MEHDRGWYRRACQLAVLALALTSCGESGARKQPDAGIDAATGSGGPCKLDTAKLDNCTL
jgi:hypothetical protein